MSSTAVAPRARKTFSRLKHVLDLPNLIDIQKASFAWFLDEGLRETINDISPINDYFADAASGTLPNVVMVDPAFQGPDRADDHPHGDIRIGQRFVQSVFGALANSPQWSRSVFALTYDEWGGFFDHVQLGIAPDVVAEHGQRGSRIPTLLIGPRVRRHNVSHRTFDHTSILKFIEWRFGLPARAPRDAAACRTCARQALCRVGDASIPEDEEEGE